MPSPLPVEPLCPTHAPPTCPLPQGGGVKRLFRKVDDKSSMYEPGHPGTVRRQGSFMYEEFLTTGGAEGEYRMQREYMHWDNAYT